MSEKPATELEDEEESEEIDLANAGSIEALTAAGDADTLLALAKAYRAGTSGYARDMKKCFDAYRAAATLGNADAEYAVALFYLSGGVVPQDMREGTTHLRAAADRGNLSAKVYLGNLYELGIHYKADPEKADVWYRNAARAAIVKGAPDTEEHTRAMAELGAVRHFLEIKERGTRARGEKEAPKSPLDVTDAELEGLARKAKALGHQHKLREEKIAAGERASVVDPEAGLAIAQAARSAAKSAPKQGTASVAEKLAALAAESGTGDTKVSKTAQATQATTPKAGDKKETQKKPAPKKPSRVTLAAGLAAFAYTILFFAVAAGAGYALTEGARVLIAKQGPLPKIGTHVEYIFPAAIALFGVLPTFLVYRASTVFRAFVVSAVAAGIGWTAWGTGQGAMHANRALQTGAAAAAGFLAALLLFGILGGAKRARIAEKPRARRTDADVIANAMHPDDES